MRVRVFVLWAVFGPILQTFHCAVEASKFRRHLFLEKSGLTPVLLKSQGLLLDSINLTYSTLSVIASL
jgi:hypothetical protein